MHVPTTTDMHATKERVFYADRAEMLQARYKVRAYFCRGICEERALVGSRGIAIVEAVTRKRLVTDWER
jgi:hypothetical protein